jgi:hypothetical protein
MKRVSLDQIRLATGLTPVDTDFQVPAAAEPREVLRLLRVLMKVLFVSIRE